jgi:hypothetical protein
LECPGGGAPQARACPQRQLPAPPLSPLLITCTQKQCLRRWYAPSRFRTADDATALSCGAPGHPPPGTPQPPALPLTLLTWVWPLLRLREAEVLRVTGGLDVVMYLRVVRFGERLHD